MKRLKFFIYLIIVIFFVLSLANFTCLFANEKKEISNLETEKERKKKEKEEEKRREEQAKQEMKEKLEMEKQRIRLIKEEIEKITKDEKLYYGRGMAELSEFGGKKWNAIETAEDRARKELSMSIESKIKGSVIDILRTTEKGDEEQFKRIIEIYTDKTLNEVSTKSWEDYEKEGEITAIATLNKDVYKKKVDDDLKAKKSKIFTYVTAGIKAYRSKLFANAIGQFSQAKKCQNELFQNLPVNDDIDNDGKDEEIGAFIDIQLSNIINGILLKGKDEKLAYTITGSIPKKPWIFAHYIDKSETFPVANLPLKSKFIKGEGKISNINVLTGQGGDAEIPVEYIDPASKEAILQVEVDLSALGCENLTAPPYCRVGFRKRQSIAYSVNFFNNDIRTEPKSLIADVKSVISDSIYGMLDYPIKTKEPTQDDISKVANLNADYLLVVTVSANSNRMGDYNFFKAYSSANVMIYSLPEGELISTIGEVPSGSGSGSTPSDAGLQAMNKIRGLIKSMVKEKIKELDKISKGD